MVWTRPRTQLHFGAGETYDFDFQPQKVGNLELHAGVVMLHTTMPIPVIALTSPAVSKPDH